MTAPNVTRLPVPTAPADPADCPDPAGILDDVEAFLGRFVAYPSDHARVAHTLWVAHTHCMDAWESTPRIAFLSPEPSSGKTRALEATELLVPRPVEAVNVTPAYLFRKVADPDGPPTVLFDEIDTVFGPKARDNEEIRGLLNAGHRRGAVAGRCVVRGKTVLTEELPAYCAVALAGLGEVPETILARSVVVRMRRRAPGEQVEPYRRRVHAPEGEQIRGRLAVWADAHRDALSDAWPDMPAGIADRDADVWEALLAVADAAGGRWPNRARVAAVALVAAAKESTPSLGVRLLADLRDLFDGPPCVGCDGCDGSIGSHSQPRAAVSTKDVLDALHKLDEAPWGDLYGKPLTERGLAQRLRKYGVKSKTVRVDEATAKGYTREDLWDAWQRYLPLSPLGSPQGGNVTCVTTDTAGGVAPPPPGGPSGEAAAGDTLLPEWLGGAI